jgi:hypothetical protein
MGGAWYRSRTARIAGAVVVLLALGALAIPFLIPVDRYRPLLVWAIQNGTGRTVEIDRLELSLFPALRIRVVNFRMKNPSGFPAGDALVAKSVDLGLDARALLTRRLKIRYIKPSGLKVNILTDASGRTNLGTPASPRTPSPVMAGIAEGASSAITLEPIGSVDVGDAKVTFANASRPQDGAFTLEGVNGKIRAIDPAAADWAKKLVIDLDLRGSQLIVPALSKPVVFHSGDLSFSNGAARAAFSLSLASTNVTGTAELQQINPFRLSFALSAPQIDARSMAALVGRGGTAPSAIGAHTLLATGNVNIGKVSFAPFEATNIRGKLAVYTNALQLDNCTFAAYGGIVRGNAALDGARPGVPASITANVQNMNVQSALAAVGLGSGTVTGSLSASFRATTVLAADPEHALTGAGTFVVRNGSFPGMDLQSGLARSARMLSLNVPGQKTRFSYFGGDLRIADERGYSNALLLIGSGLQATTRGNFGFNRTVDYAGTGVLSALRQGTGAAGTPAAAAVRQIVTAALHNDLGATSVRVPFTLRGTFGSPQFALAGTPQILHAGNPVQIAPQQPALPSAAQGLLKLIPGL